MIFLKFYDHKQFFKDVEQCSTFESSLAGSVAGMVAAAITTPLDVAKTRIMLETGRKSTIYSVLWRIGKEEGVKRLYSGILPRSAWMGIGGLIFFFGYEFSLKLSKKFF